MFNFPIESKQALQSPLAGISFRVRLSRDFSRLYQMESFLGYFFYLREQQVIFLYYIKRLKQSSCLNQLFQNIYLQPQITIWSLVLFWGWNKLWSQKAQASPVALFP